MNGKLIIYEASGSIADPPSIVELPDGIDAFGTELEVLATLRGIIGDDIEQVPFFNSITIASEPQPCVALCGEHGKLDDKPVNRRATMIWRANLERQMESPVGMLRVMALDDVLNGTVVVLTGDDEFMESL